MESKDYRSPEILPHSAEVTDIPRESVSQAAVAKVKAAIRLYHDPEKRFRCDRVF
jgi:hypothetical protein